jgi:hypothetical protein
MRHGFFPAVALASPVYEARCDGRGRLYYYLIELIIF